MVDMIPFYEYNDEGDPDWTASGQYVKYSVNGEEFEFQFEDLWEMREVFNKFTYNLLVLKNEYLMSYFR